MVFIETDTWLAVLPHKKLTPSYAGLHSDKAAVIRI